MATQRVEIIITATGAQQAASQIEGIGKSAAGVTSTLGFLRAALVAIAAFDIALRFTELADTFTVVQNKLLLVTTSTKDLNTVYQGLFDVAQKTRAPLEETADVYVRLARSAEGSKLSAQDLLEVTTHVNEALLLSGASGQRAKQGLIELAEGLSLGALQGRQLRALITDIPELANVLGAKLKVAGSQLYEFSQINPGKITPQVVLDALRDADYLDQAYKKAQITFGQAFDKFKNSLDTFLGQLAQSTNATRLLDSALQYIAAHLGQITAGLAAFAGLLAINFVVGQILSFGAAFAGVFGIVTRLVSVFGLLSAPLTILRALFIGIGTVAAAPFLLLASVGSGLVSVFIALVNPVQTLVTLFNLLKVAIFTNPLFLIGVAVVGALVLAFALFHEQINGVLQSLGGFTGIFNTVVNYAVAAAETVIQAWKQLSPQFGAIGADIGTSIITGLKDIATSLPTTALEIVKAVGGAVNHALGFSTDEDRKRDADKAAYANSGHAGMAGEGVDAFSFAQAPDFGAGYNPAPPGAATLALRQLKDDFNKNFSDLQATGTNPLSTGIDTVIGKVKLLIGTVNSLGTTASANKDDLSKIYGPEQQTAFLEELKKKTISLISSISPLFAAQEKLAETSKAVDEAMGFLTRESTALSEELKSGAITSDVYIAKMAEIGRQLVIVKSANEQMALKVAGVTDNLQQYTEKMELLNEVLTKYPDKAALVNQAILKEQIAFDNSQTSFSSGVERTFLKMQEQSADVASGIEKSLTGAFSAAEDAVVQFVDTGKISVTSFLKTIEDDLLKSSLNGLIGQYGGALVGANAPGSKGFGSENGSLVSSLVSKGGSLLSQIPGLGFLGGAAGAASGAAGQLGSTATNPLYVMDVSISNLAGAAGGSGGASSIADAFSSLSKGGNNGFDFEGGGLAQAAGGSGGGAGLAGFGSWVAGLFGFASGGSFDVGQASSLGSINGVDNRLVAFRARDGENVTVTPQGRVPGGVTVNQTFMTPDANSFRRSQQQVLGDTSSAINRAARRNNR